MFKAKRVMEELEARLSCAESGGRAGKIERKQYGDGEHRMSIRVRNLKLEAPGSATVLVDDTSVAEVQLTDGAGKLDLRSERGDVVPAVAIGQLVELVYGGRVVASGRFALD